ncbi:MAG TPA: hypothetical protein VD887_08810 [Allosphingosinicella sp.]|nr:hypothetical protein [Allosphingosinicella sp.]HYG30301.1 hypothetical protein [Allosphingosinicella sp.]
MSDSAEHPAARRLRECPAYYRIRFDPVPVKARHDGWTPERQRGFIDRLVVTGCLARSARAVGMTPQSLHVLRKHKGAASFNRACDEAQASGRSYQNDIAILRCIEGEKVPVMYRGRCVGVKVRHDNSLLIAVLNSTSPHEATGEDPAVALARALEALDASSEAQPDRGSDIEN